MPRKSRMLKTHCKYGHELSGDNLVVYKDGFNRCKQCRSDIERERRERTKQKMIQSVVNTLFPSENIKIELIGRRK